MSDATPTEELSKADAAVDRIAALVNNLAEAKRPEAAASSLGLLLAVDSRSARDAAVSLLEEVAPVADAEVARLILATARRRVARTWPGWIDSIDGELRNDAKVQQEVQHLVKDLWRESTAEESELEPEQLEAVLASIGRLANPEIEGWNVVTDLVRSSITDVALNGSTVERQSELANQAVVFFNAGVLDFGPIAVGLAESTIVALETQWPPVAPEDPLSECVARWATLAGDEVSAELRASLVESATTSSWLQSPMREELVLAISRERLRAGEISESPFSGSDIGTLAANFGGKAVNGVVIWLESFAADADSVSNVVLAVPTAAFDSRLHDALSQFATRDASQATLAALMLIRNAQKRMPPRSVLLALRSSSHSDKRVAEELVELYEAANNNDERSNVLSAWKAAEIEDDNARKILIRRVLLPCAAGSKQGLDVALRQLELAIPPPYGTKNELRTGLRNAARDGDQRKKVSRRLGDVGLESRGVLGFGRRDT